MAKLEPGIQQKRRRKKIGGRLESEDILYGCRRIYVYVVFDMMLQTKK